MTTQYRRNLVFAFPFFTCLQHWYRSTSRTGNWMRWLCQIWIRVPRVCAKVGKESRSEEKEVLNHKVHHVRVSRSVLWVVLQTQSSVGGLWAIPWHQAQVNSRAPVSDPSYRKFMCHANPTFCSFPLPRNITKCHAKPARDTPFRRKDVRMIFIASFQGTLQPCIAPRYII